MAYTVPSEEPEVFTAGDRVQWKKRSSTFPPADGWTLTYYFRSSVANGLLDYVAGTDGIDYSIDLTPTITGALPAATYRYQSFVEKSGDRKPISEGFILVVQNPIEITTPQDFRTHARRTLDSINLLLEGRATADVQRYVFQAVGRSVDKIPINDLLKFRDYYQTMVDSEEAAAMGGKNRNVFVQFNA